MTVEDITFAVKKGDLLYIPPKLLHGFYSEPAHPLSSYNIYCDLWTDKPFGTDHHIVWKPSDFDPSLMTTVTIGTELDTLPYFLPLQYQGALSEACAEIVKNHQNNEPYSVEIVICLLKAFILQLVQLHAQDRIIDYRIKPIIERIDKEAATGAHYMSWLEESGLQRTQFHELFKQATGLSPKAYWTKTIMKQASVTLLESNRSVTDVAEDLGYSSIHHFTKQFTAFYGVSPSEFRKRKR